MNKIPVTRRALLQRVKRHLATRGIDLIAARKQREASDSYYVVRKQGNKITVISENQQLLELANQHKLLEPYEELSE